jgi:Suppressor of fused protein (SUFU)
MWSVFRRRRQAADRSPPPPSAAASTDREDDDSTVGWDAITAAATVLYGDVEPIHRAPVPGPAFGGGVQGISAYQAHDHWHLVTYGLCELYDKVSADPSTSGWGYELTLRIPLDDEPPAWAFNLMEQVARQTQLSGVVFGAGHRLDAGGPIDGERSPLTALAFTPDPQLGSIETPNGHVTFLQLVGITGEQLQEMKDTSTNAVLSRLATSNPLLVSRPTET